MRINIRIVIQRNRILIVRFAFVCEDKHPNNYCIIKGTGKFKWTRKTPDIPKIDLTLWPNHSEILQRGKVYREIEIGEDSGFAY